MCFYYTFVRDEDGMIYVGDLGTGINGPTVCKDVSGRTVVTMAYARAWGGGAAIYRVTADSIETVARAEIEPFDPEVGQDVPNGFFPEDCDGDT